jgi:hypothetical protein
MIAIDSGSVAMGASASVQLRSLRGLGSLLVLWACSSVAGAAALTVQQGDVVFGALADPTTTQQQTPICFDNSTGQIGPCTEAVAGLPEALRVEMCNLYIQLSVLKFIEPPSFCEFELLQNDSWVDADLLGFQEGFVADERAAVTLGPLAAPAQLHRVYFFFGPDDGNLFDVTLTIYEDDGSSAAPGAVLYSGDYVLIGAASYMQVIDLSAENLMLPAGHFRIALTFHHDGAPSVARDADLTIQAGRNWIYGINPLVDPINPAWYDSAAFLVPGDWVIRALVEP